MWRWLLRAFFLLPPEFSLLPLVYFYLFLKKRRNAVKKKEKSLYSPRCQLIMQFHFARPIVLRALKSSDVTNISCGTKFFPVIKSEYGRVSSLADSVQQTNEFRSLILRLPCRTNNTCQKQKLIHLWCLLRNHFSFSRISSVSITNTVIRLFPRW